MDKKMLIKILISLIITLTGTAIYFAINNDVNQQIAPQEKETQQLEHTDKSITEQWKIYKNEKNGLE